MISLICDSGPLRTITSIRSCQRHDFGRRRSPIRGRNRNPEQEPTLVAAQTSTPTTPTTVIRACYAPSIAYVRILKASQSCAKSETAIQWNQTGPIGPKGDTGAVGPTGATGPIGPTGSPGGAVASLDGIPCDQGKTTVGVTHSSIDAITRVVTLTCISSNLVTLTVNATGNGAGNITSSPAGITCGPTAGTTCSHDYNPGTPVTVIAAPAASSRFAGWSGACTGTGPCTVTMNTANTVTATFVATVTVHVTLQEPSTQPVGLCFNPFPFTTCNSEGYSGADATFDGGHQPDCFDNPLSNFYGGDETCDYVVDRGRPSINVDAKVDGGENLAVFDHWDGCDAAIGTRCAVGAGSDITITAVYSS